MDLIKVHALCSGTRVSMGFPTYEVKTVHEVQRINTMFYVVRFTDGTALRMRGYDMFTVKP